MSLLSGPVVFIDDEIDVPESEAAQLLGSIQLSGRPVVATRELPPADVREEWYQHWQTLSFLVIDWDLTPASLGGIGGSTLSQHKRASTFRFLAEVMAAIYCPIFIISREDADDIRRQVAEVESLRDASGNTDARIAVFHKSDVMDNLMAHLAETVKESPALSVLGTWDREFDAARNRMFIDLNATEPDWPVYIWRTAVADGIDPSFELSSVISANLLTRLNPVAFDTESVADDSGVASGSAIRRVLHGRTFIHVSRISDRMVFPGDVFQLDADDPDELWINISPVCQTVPRAKSGEDPRPVRLHLIRGSRADVSSRSKFKDLENRRKGPLGEVIHTLLDEDPFYFEFGEAQFVEWAGVKKYRVGRVLPPYATRLQQKHSAYLQAEGLPRIEYDVYDRLP